MPANDQLLKSITKGSAPLVVWAAHFFGVYVIVAAACTGAVRDGVHDRMAVLGMPLILLSALALGVVATLLWRALRRPHNSLLAWARIGGALLALIAIAWTSVPLLILPPCP